MAGRQESEAAAPKAGFGRLWKPLPPKQGSAVTLRTFARSGCLDLCESFQGNVCQDCAWQAMRNISSSVTGCVVPTFHSLCCAVPCRPFQGDANGVSGQSPHHRRGGRSGRRRRRAAQRGAHALCTSRCDCRQSCTSANASLTLQRMPCPLQSDAPAAAHPQPLSLRIIRQTAVLWHESSLAAGTGACRSSNPPPVLR